MSAVLGFAVYKLNGRLDQEYAEILPPAQWMGMTLVNASGQIITLSTNPADPLCEVDIEDQSQFMIQAIYGPTSSGSYRFNPDQPAFYLKTASGDGTGAYIVWA